MCLLRCSGHGTCDPITKECVCDPFWTENLIRRFFGDGESNCGELCSFIGPERTKYLFAPSAVRYYIHSASPFSILFGRVAGSLLHPVLHGHCLHRDSHLGMCVLLQKVTFLLVLRHTARSYIDFMMSCLLKAQRSKTCDFYIYTTVQRFGVT